LTPLYVNFEKDQAFISSVVFFLIDGDFLKLKLIFVFASSIPGLGMRVEQGKSEIRLFLKILP